MRLGILLSGRGSNFIAICDSIAAGRLHAEIALVLSNRGDAPGIQAAQARGLPACILESKGIPRAQHDAAMIRALNDAGVDLVVLAGYLRLLAPTFIRSFPQRIVNIHPSLLPAFPGLHAQQQALDYGAKIAGCTVHFVSEGLDDGPIILQRSVPVLDGDSEESLSARILEQEHIAYSEALQLMATDRIRIDGRRVIVCI